MGKNNDTWKFIYNDEICFIKFKATEDDIILNWINNAWDDEENKTFNIVGKCNINNYNGILTLQVIVEDYEELEDD